MRVLLVRFLKDSYPSSRTVDVEKMAFSSLTSSSHRRSFLILRRKSSSNKDLRGMQFESWRCVGLGELEFIIFNCLFGSRKALKKEPKYWSSQSRTNICTCNFQKGARAKKKAE